MDHNAFYSREIVANLFVYIVDFTFEVRAWAVRQATKLEWTPAKRAKPSLIWRYKYNPHAEDPN